MMFSKIGGKPKDLFGKKFDENISFTQISKSADGVKFKVNGSGNLTTGPFTKGKFTTTVPYPELGNLELEATTDGKGSIKVTNKKLVKGLVAEAKVSASPDLNLKAEYVQDKLTFSGAVTTALTGKYDTGVELTASAGVSGFTVGGNFKYNVNGDKPGVSDFGIAAEGPVGPITAALTTKKSLSVFTVRALYKHDANLDCGVEVEYTPPESPDAARPYSVLVAAKHQVDADTTVKVKANVLSSDITVSLEHSLKEPQVQIGTMYSVNAKSQNFAATKWGLWFSFGDY